MLKLESQQNYIYLGKTDQGLSLVRQKAAGIFKNISSFINNKNMPIPFNTSPCIYQDFRQSVSSPKIDSRYPSIKYYANHKVRSGLLWEGKKKRKRDKRILKYCKSMLLKIQKTFKHISFNAISTSEKNKPQFFPLSQQLMFNVEWNFDFCFLKQLKIVCLKSYWVDQANTSLFCRS